MAKKPTPIRGMRSKRQARLLRKARLLMQRLGVILAALDEGPANDGPTRRPRAVRSSREIPVDDATTALAEREMKAAGWLSKKA